MGRTFKGEERDRHRSSKNRRRQRGNAARQGYHDSFDPEPMQSLEDPHDGEHDDWDSGQ
jgi:hypothetical protein